MANGLGKFLDANRGPQGRERSVPQKERRRRLGTRLPIAGVSQVKRHRNAATIAVTALRAPRGASLAPDVVDRWLRGTPLAEARCVARVAARDQHLRGIIKVRSAYRARGLGVPRRPVGDDDRVPSLARQASRVPRRGRDSREAVTQALNEDSGGDASLRVREAGFRPDPPQEMAHAVYVDRPVRGGSRR